MSLERLRAALADRYDVQREIGAGGMATVFLARDLRHDREVAIKVLHPDLAAALGGDRFLAEIKTTARLQHPHILPLLDSGSADGLLFYVMPYVTGETLRARLAREGPLPVADALRITSEVADALGAAHAKGVVHRDVKPDNILLQDGHALVADFGIALAVATAGGERITQTGLSLGTPQYMSPEQAMGEKTLDARSDIYALGVVTYEMLAGEPPFTGPSVQTVIARLMHEEPRGLSTQRKSVPAGVEHAVMRALEKLPADRFATAGEFAAALSSPDTVSTARPERRGAPGVRHVAAAAGIAAVALVAGWTLGRLRPSGSGDMPPSRLALVGARLGGTGLTSMQRGLAITPDGTTLLYVSKTAEGTSQIVRQALDATEPTPIAGVRAETTAPTISADGRFFIGWVGDERIPYRYAIAGGPGEPLAFSGRRADHAQWDAKGALWFSPREGGGLWRFEQGDSVARLAVPGSAGTRFQQLLPDGRHAVVMLRATTQSGAVGIMNLESGEKSVLISTGVVEARYAAGFLVYVLANGTLHAAPFDAGQRRLTGPSIVVGTDVSASGLGVAQFAVATNGTVAYIVEEAPSLAIFDQTGASRPLVEEKHNYHGPRFSPDGRRISVDFNSADGRDVWTVATTGGSLTRATFLRDGHDAVWSPDGRSLAFISARSGTEAIYRKRPEGTVPPESLFASAKIGFTGAWIPDESAIVTIANDLRPGSGSDLVLVRNGGRGPFEALVATEFTEAFPALSPNGKWVAFTSDRSGRSEVYVSAVGHPADIVQVTDGGGTEPEWNPNGREIFYRTLSDTGPRLAVVAVRTEPSFAMESRRTLFTMVDVVAANPHSNYAVGPDGRTFVMVRRGPATRIVVIQNLPALYRRLQER